MIECSVRLCEPDDLPRLAQLAVTYHREAGDERLPLNLDKALKVIYHAITQMLAIGVCDEDGSLIGAIILNLDAPWWSDGDALWEAGFYVQPEMRKGTGAAALLLDAAKAVADQIGVPLFITPMTEVDLDLKDRFFRTHGFRPVGRFFRYG